MRIVKVIAVCQNTTVAHLVVLQLHVELRLLRRRLHALHDVARAHAVPLRQVEPRVAVQRQRLAVRPVTPQVPVMDSLAKRPRSPCCDNVCWISLSHNTTLIDVGGFVRSLTSSIILAQSCRSSDLAMSAAQRFCWKRATTS